MHFSTSLAYQDLVTHNPVSWLEFPELALSGTAINGVEDQVGNHHGNQPPYSKTHSASQFTLRRLCVLIYKTIYRYPSLYWMNTWSIWSIGPRFIERYISLSRWPKVQGEVAECFRSCLKLTLILWLTSRCNRLVPCLFCWSQNFHGRSPYIPLDTTQSNVARYMGAALRAKIRNDQ